MRTIVSCCGASGEKLFGSIILELNANKRVAENENCSIPLIDLEFPTLCKITRHPWIILQPKTHNCPGICFNCKETPEMYPINQKNRISIQYIITRSYFTDEIREQT